jgi:predicted RNA binding protein YcfA (HicA-like mRNA interferase family)
MPARFREVMHAMKACGVTTYRRAGKGSHVVLADGKGNAYAVSLHNGDRTVISDVYLRGICRAFGIDFETFKSKL